MMATDGEALLRAIASGDRDDLTRLAYADWLQENGDADAQSRGLFIREQIAGRRARGLLKQNAGRWWPFAGFVKGYWRRGFVWMVKCDVDAWLTFGPQIVRHHPVRRLDVGVSMNVELTDHDHIISRGYYHPPPLEVGGNVGGLRRYEVKKPPWMAGDSLGPYPNVRVLLADAGKEGILWARKEAGITWHSET